MSRPNVEDAAWRLVIEAGDSQRPLSWASIGRTTGASMEKVAAMAMRYRAMHQAGVTPTGNWWHDRVNTRLPAPPPTTSMNISND